MNMNKYHTLKILRLYSFIIYLKTSQKMKPAKYILYNSKEKAISKTLDQENVELSKSVMYFREW